MIWKSDIQKNANTYLSSSINNQIILVDDMDWSMKISKCSLKHTSYQLTFCLKFDDAKI